MLSQIVAGMQRAGKDISERQVSAETVRVQTEVLSGLDLLIRLAEQNPPPDSPPPTPPPNRPPPTPETPPPGQPQGEGSDATGRKAGSDSRRTDQDPQNASDGSGSSPPDTEAPATRRRVIVREIWGHLPPALQRRLISGEDEKPLPRYERLVEKYFESLAEQSAAKRGSSPQK